MSTCDLLCHPYRPQAAAKAEIYKIDEEKAAAAEGKPAVAAPVGPIQG